MLMLMLMLMLVMVMVMVMGMVDGDEAHKGLAGRLWACRPHVGLEAQRGPEAPLMMDDG